MPKVSHAETVMDWHNLIENARQHADLPGLGEKLAALEMLLNRSRELQAHRARLDAESQTATRQLADTERQGKALTSRIRSLLKAVYGTTNDGLLAFGMRPRRLARGAESSKVLLPLPETGDSSPSDQNG